VDEAVELLKRTPEVLRAQLGGLGEHWLTSGYGEGTFTPFDVVGHLIHGERTDWMVRVRHILEHGERVAFTPFDRFAMYRESRGRPIGELLQTFAELRAANLAALSALELTSEDLGRRGLHPNLGVVTLGQLLATWAVHDLNHVAQIERGMSFRYRESVGPWVAYLGILPKE
jgi:hypothetical protein